MWRLWLVGIRMTLIFLAAQVAALAGSRLAYPEDYADPFAPYEAIMPGQLVAPGDYACDPPASDLSNQSVRCELRADSSHFGSVSATILGRRFIQISFRGHDLYIGDVVSRWGRPDMISRTDQYFYVLWNNRGLMGIIDPVGPIGRFRYRLPVERFAIGLQQFNNIP
jgi:hypothetical protein